MTTVKTGYGSSLYPFEIERTSLAVSGIFASYCVGLDDSQSGYLEIILLARKKENPMSMTFGSHTNINILANLLGTFKARQRAKTFHPNQIIPLTWFSISILLSFPKRYSTIAKPKSVL